MYGIGLWLPERRAMPYLKGMRIACPVLRPELSFADSRISNTYNNAMKIAR